MYLSKSCCTLKPVESNYKPQGSFFTVKDLEYYSIGDEKDPLILLVYDLAGKHNNAYQFGDILASAGYHVIIPDFFRNKPWPLEDWPTKNMDKLIHMATVEYSFDNKIHEDILLIYDHLNIDRKAPNVGVVGFCWGGKIVFDALKLQVPIFKAGVAIHPSFIVKESFEAINQPILFAPTKEEREIMHYFNLIKPELLKESEMHDFTDNVHGFAATRGDFTDEHNCKRVNDVIKLTADFFSKHLSK
ncbi:alpha/beta-hydrolase [Neoconidiobolus thromboides FSU 785]|nr:alpha/beta-hydrolase [Neoconidiobolus thromboides FSU 785]